MTGFLRTALLVFCLSCNAGPGNGSTLLSPDEFETRLHNKPEAQLIDVRTPAEFSGGHIANARNLNIHDDHFAAEIAKLDKSKPVMVYCARGARSATATEQLKRAGFPEVYDLEGGMEAWRGAGKNTVQ